MTNCLFWYFGKIVVCTNADNAIIRGVIMLCIVNKLDT